VKMANSLHGELRKPSTAAAETTNIAANLRAKEQDRRVRKKGKIEHQLTPNRSGAIPKRWV